MSYMHRYTLIVGMAGYVVYSALVPLSDATGLSVGDLNAETGYLFLLCGWDLLFWQPFALQYGKRPTYLISLLATLVSKQTYRTRPYFIAKSNLLGSYNMGIIITLYSVFSILYSFLTSR